MFVNELSGWSSELEPGWPMGGRGVLALVWSRSVCVPARFAGLVVWERGGLYRHPTSSLSLAVQSNRLALLILTLKLNEPH